LDGRLVRIGMRLPAGGGSNTIAVARQDGTTEAA
jgi:hypothetical protein